MSDFNFKVMGVAADGTFLLSSDEVKSKLDFHIGEADARINELEKENHQAGRLIQSLRKKLENSELHRDADGITNSSDFELILELKQKSQELEKQLAESVPKSEIKKILNTTGESGFPSPQESIIRKLKKLTNHKE